MKNQIAILGKIIISGGLEKNGFPRFTISFDAF